VIGDPDYAERWRSRSQLGFTPMVSSPWRFQARLIELWDEGDSELIGGRAWDELALESLAAALDELEERYGDDPAGWTWGRVQRTQVSATPRRGRDARVPAGSTACSRGTYPWAAARRRCAGGLRPPRRRLHPALGALLHRLLADLGSPDRSRWQHMTGQSGQPSSPHYDDLLEDWHAGLSYEFGQLAAQTLRLDPA